MHCVCYRCAKSGELDAEHHLCADLEGREVCLRLLDQASRTYPGPGMGACGCRHHNWNTPERQANAAARFIVEEVAGDLEDPRFKPPFKFGCRHPEYEEPCGEEPSGQQEAAATLRPSARVDWQQPWPMADDLSTAQQQQQQQQQPDTGQLLLPVAGAPCREQPHVPPPPASAPPPPVTMSAKALGKRKVGSW